MNRVSWWIHTHRALLAYLFVVVLVVGLFVVAIVRDGGQ